MHYCGSRLGLCCLASFHPNLHHHIISNQPNLKEILLDVLLINGVALAELSSVAEIVVVLISKCMIRLCRFQTILECTPLRSVPREPEFNY